MMCTMKVLSVVTNESQKAVIAFNSHLQINDNFIIEVYLIAFAFILTAKRINSFQF